MSATQAVACYARTLALSLPCSFLAKNNEGTVFVRGEIDQTFPGPLPQRSSSQARSMPKAPPHSTQAWSEVGLVLLLCVPFFSVGADGGDADEDAFGIA